MAEPNRRAILSLLLEEDRSAGQIVDALDVGQPTVSKHLRLLREAGLVEARVDANRRIYHLLPEPLAELEVWLLPFRRVWASRLDALEAFLDQNPDDR
ncbi:MAG: metalloregulator ArsR/SmtB family transcription factor, partial [Ilumatobacter sp.]|uniref:ArsR/SmtB family transcription factor n=1 Tax=Ilumatobacter sp. TaxID=1967498 RepID=UPI003297EF96